MTRRAVLRSIGALPLLPRTPPEPRRDCPPPKAWVANVAAHRSIAPVVAEGALRIYDRSGTVHAFDVTTGERLWATPSGLTTLTGHDGGDFFAGNTADGRGAVVDFGVDGERRVFRRTGRNPKVASSARLGIGDADGLLVSSGGMGSVRWRHEPRPGSQGISALVGGQGLLFAVNRQATTDELLAIDADSGLVLWTETADRTTALLLGSDVLFVARRNEVAAHRTETGERLWRCRTDGIDPHLGRVPWFLYLRTAAGDLVAIDTRSGAVAWERLDLRLAGPVQFAISAGRTLYVQTPTALHALASDTGALNWSARPVPGARFVHAPCADQHEVFVAEARGRTAVVRRWREDGRERLPLGPYLPITHLAVGGGLLSVATVVDFSVDPLG